MGQLSGRQNISPFCSEAYLDSSSELFTLSYFYRIECVRRLMYNKYKWEEWAKEGFTVPMPDPVGQRTDSMSCLKTLISLYAEGQQLVPIQEEGERISQNDKVSSGPEIDGTMSAGKDEQEESEM